MFRTLRIASLALLCALGLSGCGYNEFQRLDEQVKAGMSEVLNQYQRRADLVPNLVQTVKGFAAQEQAVLIGVTEARAKLQAGLDSGEAAERFSRMVAALGGPADLVEHLEGERGALRLAGGVDPRERRRGIGGAVGEAQAVEHELASVGEVNAQPIPADLAGFGFGALLWQNAFNTNTPLFTFDDAYKWRFVLRAGGGAAA